MPGGVFAAISSAPIVSVHVATLLFGLAGVLGAAIGLGAFEVTFGRTLFAALALLGVCLYSGVAIKLPMRNVNSYLLLFSGALLAFHWWIFFASIQLSTVAIGLVTFSTCPVFVAILEPFFFKEKWRAATLLASLMVLAGVLVISGISSGEVIYSRGILFGLASGFTFAILQLLNRRLANSSGPLLTSLIQNSVASIVLLPIVYTGLNQIEVPQWALLVVLGVACTALAHTLFINALKRVSVSTASLIAAGLEPVYGVALAMLILFQKPAIHVLAGGAIILATVLLFSITRQS